MTWHEVTFKCGCEGLIEIRGSWVDIEREAKWIAADRDCTPCYTTQVERRRAEELAAAKLQAAERHLPALDGSEKQIVWAETIRAEIVDVIDRLREKHSGNGEQVSLLDEGARTLLSNTSSHFWINEMRLTTMRPELLDGQLRRSAKLARKAAAEASK